MGTSIIETRKIGKKAYRIVLLDDKYTVYVSASKKELTELSDSDFSAIASFGTLKEAKDHVPSHTDD